MKEGAPNSSAIEAATHEAIRQEGIQQGYAPDEPRFYVIRTISPAAHTVMIGRDAFSNDDLRGLLQACGEVKVMTSPDELYERIKTEAKTQSDKGESITGTLPKLWKTVFAQEIGKVSPRPDCGFPGQLENGNLQFLSENMEEFVREGIGSAFDKLRLTVEVEGEEFEVRQRCPVKNMVKSRWLPAYTAIRERFLVEQPDLIPKEELETIA